MQHVNWICSRLHSKSINEQLNVKIWKPNANMDDFSYSFNFWSSRGFIRLSTFYWSKPKDAGRGCSYFVEMESDERLCRTTIAAIQKVHIVRHVNFRSCQAHEFSSISTLLKGLSQQHEVGAHHGLKEYAEEGFVRCLLSIYYHFLQTESTRKLDVFVSFMKHSSLNAFDTLQAVNIRFALKKPWLYGKRTKDCNSPAITWFIRHQATQLSWKLCLT